jgi:hypothetical protein
MAQCSNNVAVTSGSWTLIFDSTAGTDGAPLIGVELTPKSSDCLVCIEGIHLGASAQTNYETISNGVTVQRFADNKLTGVGRITRIWAKSVSAAGTISAFPIGI